MAISASGIVILAVTLTVARPVLAQTPEAPAGPGRPQPAAAAPSPEAAAPGGPGSGLLLVGVIMEEGRAPVALIEVSRERRQALYRVGDTIGEARLERILTDRAILRHRGQEVELRLAGSPAATAPPAPAAPAAAGQRDAGVNARLRELARLLRDNPNDTEASAEMRRLRAERRPPPATARELAQSSAEPDVASAIAVEGGVRLTEVTEGGLLARLGLRAGDIVRSVNQRPVGPQQSLGQALAEAAATGREGVRIEILRNGVRTLAEPRLRR